jgi:hypothetical protein
MHLSNQSLLVILVVGIVGLAGQHGCRGRRPWTHLGFSYRINWSVHWRLVIASAWHSLGHRYRGIDSQRLRWRCRVAANLASRYWLARWVETAVVKPHESPLPTTVDRRGSEQRLLHREGRERLCGVVRLFRG